MKDEIGSPKITEFEVQNTGEHRFGILEDGKLRTLYLT